MRISSGVRTYTLISGRSRKRIVEASATPDNDPSLENAYREFGIPYSPNPVAPRKIGKRERDLDDLEERGRPRLPRSRGVVAYSDKDPNHIPGRLHTVTGAQYWPIDDKEIPQSLSASSVRGSLPPVLAMRSMRILRMKRNETCIFVDMTLGVVHAVVSMRNDQSLRFWTAYYNRLTIHGKMGAVVRYRTGEFLDKFCQPKARQRIAFYNNIAQQWGTTETLREWSKTTTLPNVHNLVGWTFKDKTLEFLDLDRNLPAKLDYNTIIQAMHFIGKV